MLVRQFLSESHVPFETVDHDPTYTAQALAEAAHISGECVAKTVLLMSDRGPQLAVLPATHTIDMPLLQQTLRANDVHLATEFECGAYFGDCEVGAVPPFGSQYGMTTLLDESLLQVDEITFEANTHREAVRMQLEDYLALERPQVSRFSHHL